jgi:Response regulator containing a CheY-like receiver domain and an HD-GYP domain
VSDYYLERDEEIDMEAEKGKNELNSKLLIIDDNFSNALLLEKMLKIHGYNEIKIVTDSRESVSIYNEYKPDLLLLDLRMPYLDGLQVMEALNAIKEDDYLPVIVVTAESDKEYRLRALQAGAKDFILKPFDHAEVFMRIKNMLEIRMLHKEVRSHNRMLEDKVKERTKALENFQFELLQRLLRAAEFRDNGTGDHISRIGLYVFEFSKALGFNSEYCNILMHASMMHDIGKIGIPDNILMKPGKLNDDEWEKMKTHTLKGGEILANSSLELVRLAEQIALTHHEKWDGSGYPNGLKGEEIPLHGRIVAICDVFDALLSERPYKMPWTLDGVINQIKKDSGKYFDPFLVDVFLRNIDTFIHIKERFD